MWRWGFGGCRRCGIEGGMSMYQVIMLSNGTTIDLPEPDTDIVGTSEKSILTPDGIVRAFLHIRRTVGSPLDPWQRLRYSWSKDSLGRNPYPFCSDCFDGLARGSELDDLWTIHNNLGSTHHHTTTEEVRLYRITEQRGLLLQRHSDAYNGRLYSVLQSRSTLHGPCSMAGILIFLGLTEKPHSECHSARERIG